MKKTMLILLLFTAVIAQAQERINPFSFGFLFTSYGTTFDSKPKIESVSPQVAFGGSAFARLKILILYAELEAGYSSHKVKTSQTFSGVKMESMYTLNGMDFSGILGWRVIGIGPLGNFRVFAGYNFNNYSKITVETNGSSVTNPGINTGNSSFILGTGVDLWRIVFNLKYNIGTTDLSSSSSQELKTRALTFAVGFRF